MVTSTTSTNHTTTGECVAELECGLQQKILLIMVFVLNSDVKSDLDAELLFPHVVVSVLLQPVTSAISTSSTSTGENNSSLYVTI